MPYLIIALSFGLAGVWVARLKGNSMFVWFLVSAIVPFLGLLAALLYRADVDEPRRPCPNCGRTCMLHDALCTRCGYELEWPEETAMQPPAPAL
jgi:hypothetical protein